jgi:phage shock protein C
MNEHLYRSRDDRMLAGVAGGLAEIWDADPSLIRIVWAILIVLTGGIALLVYIVMAIVVPEEDEFHPAAPPVAPPPVAPPPPVPPTPAGSEASAGPEDAAAAAVAPDAPVSSAFVATAVPVAAAPAAAAPTGWVDPSASPATSARASRQAARAARRAARRERGDNRTPGIVIGAILIFIGIVFFLQQWLPAFDFDLFWPLILVGLGVVLLVVGFTRDSRNGGTSA